MSLQGGVLCVLALMVLYYDNGSGIDGMSGI